MNRTRRLVVTLTATAMLASPTLPSSAANSASSTASTSSASGKSAAAPGKTKDKPSKASSAKGTEGKTKQLIKGAAVKDKQLVRCAEKVAGSTLATDTRTQLLAGIDAARAQLAEFEAGIEGADGTFDVRAAREELRSLRVENFRHAASTLKKIQALMPVATDNPEALALLTGAQSAALAITLTSAKKDIHAVRQLLNDAKAALGGADEPADEVG